MIALPNWKSIYEKKISNGEIIVNQKITKALKLIDDRVNKYTFSQEEADYYIDFIEKFCSHYKGKFAGKRLELSLWQKVIIESIFGILHENKRVTREAFVVVARKNGKSTLAAGISLAMLVADGEEGAEIYSVANKLDQAKIIYKSCYNMVSSSPELSKAINKRRISLEYKTSELLPLASDSKSLDGLNPHLAVYDEGHATKNLDLYEVIDSAFGSREQPLFLHITTAGIEREGLYDYLYERAEKVLDGIIEDDTFLPFIYELDADEEYTEEKNWIKANPNLDISVDREYIRAKVDKAKSDPKSKSGILTKHFNRRQTSSQLWLSFETLNNEEKYDDLKDIYCIGGCDLSSTTDLTCATLLADVQGKILVKQMYWIPEARLQERVKEDNVPYDVWKRRGLLRTCQGSKVDYKDVTSWFVEQVKENGLRPLWVGFDSWNAKYWADEMVQYGFEMVEVRQGAKTMSSPMKQMAADLMDKKINYNNNPILKWCLTNIGIKEDENGNIQPIKGKNQRARIDGAVSLIDAYVIYNNKYSEYLAYLK